MKAAVIQSNYLPWKGYFDIIHDADMFVFLDDVQFSKGSWRNRNRIKSPGGVQWITVPLKQDGLIHSMIDEVSIHEQNWQERHLNQLENSYKKAPYYQHYLPLLHTFYRENRWSNLSEMNQWMIRAVAKELGIEHTSFVNARELNTTGVKDDKVIQILQRIGADEYISGPSARDYMQMSKWEKAGIRVVWKEYVYPEYPQLYPPFEHAVSVLDLLFMHGPASAQFIWAACASG